MNTVDRILLWGVFAFGVVNLYAWYVAQGKLDELNKAASPTINTANKVVTGVQDALAKVGVRL
jgi:hypothetical protein